MDAFEAVVALSLRRRGYWVQQSTKVALTRTEKAAIGRPSCPRWEIDLVAYQPRGNKILAVECKSFLDSPGVQLRGGKLFPASRYKLFREPKTRKVVLKALGRQLTQSGHVKPSPKVTLCLAAGKVDGAKTSRKLGAMFTRRNWLFISPSEIVDCLKTCVGDKYENDVAFVVAKLLGRSRS